jgi:hypothetical protein
MIEIEIYDDSKKGMWDEFVQRSKNGPFLFFRDYMDYHRDRFEDHSLLIHGRKGELIALLPAHEQGDTLCSHGGLTYGGFVTDEQMKTPTMLEVFDRVLTHLERNGFTRFIYKTIPHIYHRFPAEEDKYALFLCNAKLVRRSVITAVSSTCRLPFQERRGRGIKKAKKCGLVVRRSNDFESYWRILAALLEWKHGTRPVHSLEEMNLLRSRFPDNIKLFACFSGATMLGGVVVYECDRVARAQYIAANEQGYDLGALDLVFSFLLGSVYHQKPFFEFGTSDEENGRYLNKGLISQKEEFGARAVVHDHYEIDLSNWEPGQLTGVMTK